MSTPESSLPEPWVERIWSTMRGFYGAAFDRQWECPLGLDPVAHVTELKAIWGRELRGFQQNPKAIAYGLEHLPENVPNLPQFLALCKRAPMFVAKELPWPKPDRAIVERVVGAVSRSQRGPRAWMASVQRRIDAGDYVSIAVRDMLRRAEQSVAARSDE